MTQPVAPGARVACFDEAPAEPVECTSPPLPPSLPPAMCSAELEAFEAARDPPRFEPSAALRFCRDADSVVEGFLCSEPVVVSNACRKPTNAFDSYICDEPKMQALQRKVWHATLWVIKTLISQILGGGKAR